MIVNENVSLNTVISVTLDGGFKKPILSANCSLEKSGLMFGLNFNIMDDEELQKNLTYVQTELNSFIGTVKLRMTELGYKVTL